MVLGHRRKDQKPAHRLPNHPRRHLHQHRHRQLRQTLRSRIPKRHLKTLPRAHLLRNRPADDQARHKPRRDDRLQRVHEQVRSITAKRGRPDHLRTSTGEARRAV